MITCSRCRGTFDETNFANDAGRDTGRDYYCRPCRNRVVAISKASRKITAWTPQDRYPREHYEVKLAELVRQDAEARGQHGVPWVPRDPRVARMVVEAEETLTRAQERARDFAEIVARLDWLQARVEALEAASGIRMASDAQAQEHSFSPPDPWIEAS